MSTKAPGVPPRLAASLSGIVHHTGPRLCHRLSHMRWISLMMSLDPSRNAIKGFLAADASSARLLRRPVEGRQISDRKQEANGSGSYLAYFVDQWFYPADAQEARLQACSSATSVLAALSLNVFWHGRLPSMAGDAFCCGCPACEFALSSPMPFREPGC